jgi:ADP-heptose:LPS heptosyltransferase
VITPLFEALRRRFPEAHIAAGVGDWNRDVLKLNPHLSEVLPVNAPWFNKYQGRQGTHDRLAYVRRSSEAQELASRGFEIGIDVLGSAWGSLLLLRAGIPYRLGVRGYAGGHSVAQATVLFDPCLHVGRAALRFAEILGATGLPANRPQIFLAPEEIAEAESAWAAHGQGRRVLVGPGGGLPEKCWPAASYAGLVAGMDGLGGLSILVLGGPREEAAVAAVAAASPRAWHLPAPPPLRQVFALTAAADLVVCNSSMLMHVAAAFCKPTLVLLGESFNSASQHQEQWGYPGICRSLGRDPGARSRIQTPDEALAAVRQEMETRWG